MSETTIKQLAGRTSQRGVLRRGRGRHHMTAASLRVVDIQRSTSNEILAAAVNAPEPIATAPAMAAEIDALAEAYESALRASAAWAVSA